jgi:putative FmdB family regulatory protein
MPFYEYECASCKFYTEVMQKISDAPLEKCPSCGKKALKKLVSAPVFRLKGGGWYETDFKSDQEDKRNIADRDEPASKPEEAKTGESKPAAEPAGKAAGEGGSAAAADSARQAKAPAESRGRGEAGRTSGRGSAKRTPSRSGASRAKPGGKPHPKPAPKARAKAAARKKGRR